MRGLRVGIVGPRHPFGERLRTLLDEGRLPVIELKLFESTTAGESTLSQFGEDIIVTQPLDADLFPQLDVLFFDANDSDVYNRMAGEAAEAGVLTLVHGATGLEAPVLLSAEGAVRLAAVPRSASHLVGKVLGRVAESRHVVAATATILLPAEERGRHGAEELHQQVVNLLNFKEIPTDVLGEQLAFNVRLPGVPSGSGRLEAVTAEAVELAGVGEILTANLVQVPVFHAYSASIWCEIEEAIAARALSALFSEPPFEVATRRTSSNPSPVGIGESNRIHVGGLRVGELAGRHGFWLWAVADTTAYDPGNTALEIAASALA